MSTETTKKLKMKFITDSGENFNVNLNYIKPNLAEGEGATLVNNAMNSIMTNQPFDRVLVGKNGAEIVETTTTDVVFD